MPFIRKMLFLLFFSKLATWRYFLLIPLAVPKIAYRLGAPSNFDRCAILTSLHPPLAVLR